MVAVNIIGDPADFGDESNIVSRGSFIPKERHLFLTRRGHSFLSQKCHPINFHRSVW